MPPTRKTKPTAQVATKEAVLKSFSALSADDRAWVIRQQKLEEETTALRTRLPEFLQPFASAVAVRHPLSEQERVERREGPNFSGFDFCMSCVYLTITTKPARRKTAEKRLKIESEKWGTCGRAMTSCASSSKNAIYLSYGEDKRGVAYAAGYSDPGTDMYAHSAKGVQEIVRDVVKDMGCEKVLSADACMEVLDAFVSGLGEYLLDYDAFEEGSLRKIIRNGLQRKTGRYDRIGDMEMI